MAGVRVEDILASLAAGGPADSWPTQLVTACRIATQMSDVGLALIGPDGPYGALATTGTLAQAMEDLQFALGEGPCIDAAQSGGPVLVADLKRDAATRWPAFTAQATEAGIQAAFIYPLQVGAIRIGVLNLYRTSARSLSEFEATRALAFADAAVAVLLHLQDVQHDETSTALASASPGGSGVPAQGWPAGPGVDLAEVVERRAVVHQAAGMLSVQLDMTLGAAMSRLRAYASTARRPMIDVAADIVDRRLELDLSHTGEVGARELQNPPPAGEEERS